MTSGKVTTSGNAARAHAATGKMEGYMKTSARRTARNTAERNATQRHATPRDTTGRKASTCYYYYCTAHYWC
jgi:hypothetical protein